MSDLNDFGKSGLWVLGGVALGVVGTLAVTHPKTRPILVDLVSRGLNLKEGVQGTLERAKEEISDLVAEAAAAAEERRTPSFGPEAPAEA